MVEKTMVVNIRRIPVSLWRKARAAAAYEGITVREWTIQAITEKLDKKMAHHNTDEPISTGD